MSVMTAPWLQPLRRAARRLGVTKIIGGLLAGGQYEARLNDAMSASIRPGDCVWDVGANMGLYTAVFAGLTGEGGHVFAFEPSPQNVQSLRRATSAYSNVTVLNIGLSDRDENARFKQGADDIGATSQVVSGTGQDSGQFVEVVLRSGDALIAAGGATSPNVLKIDVEGHELEVLTGLKATLARPDLRHIFIEVHFTLLEERGSLDAPARIEALLRANGFGVRWIDPSHLYGKR
jgi:FkbM family methyltransferase